MSIHRLKLVYDGLDAAEDRMPTSLESQISEGARIFLGAHACYLTEGSVPDRIMDRTEFYTVHDYRQRPGCWIGEWDLTFLVASGYLLARVADIGVDLAKDYVKQTVRDSYAAWKARRPMAGTSFERIEPVLDMPGRLNTPVFDFEAEYEQQRRRLYARVDQSMAKISAPIRRAALRVDIWFDGERLDSVTHRYFTDDDIGAALLPLQRRYYPNASRRS